MQQGIRIHVNRFIYNEGEKATCFKYVARRNTADVPQRLGDECGAFDIYTILILLSQENSLISKMEPIHLMNLIKKADEFLLQISSRLELPYEPYHSLLRNKASRVQ